MVAIVGINGLNTERVETKNLKTPFRLYGSDESTTGWDYSTCPKCIRNIT
ncbi:hypothetical protein COLO4_37291 [Corchorus olitorius]|uniref:Uncharacterized protein n=1 Tax=Corchorus olitorius TaxID=93759 RepID=A0A1R3G2M6_9ROSI|nr:hypothetical protein COLO4_37291 [Corchorus olitorius]